MDKQKEILIEQSANLYKSIGYPRIAGKIMGLLYVSEQKHFTFQELMDTLNISKGATSTALNFLIIFQKRVQLPLYKIGYGLCLYGKNC